MTAMARTVAALLAPGKGILAADESLPTISSRFAPHGIQSTCESRRAYREMLFTTPGIERTISGVIMFEETLRQGFGTGVSFADHLASRGIVPGIKVDAGTSPLDDGLGWRTDGLVGLEQRIEDHLKRGAHFAKWRAVFALDGCEPPAPRALEVNAASMARYAAACQRYDLLPIVEPELLSEGGHDLVSASRAAEDVLVSVFRGLEAADVALDAMILKCAFVTPGRDGDAPASDEAIAEATLGVLRRSVPWPVPGVVFLSGGFAPARTASIFRRVVEAAGRVPWRLTFSFGRALQDEALTAWDGREQFVEAAQEAFAERALSLADISARQLPLAVRPAHHA